MNNEAARGCALGSADYVASDLPSAEDPAGTVVDLQSGPIADVATPSFEPIAMRPGPRLDGVVDPMAGLSEAGAANAGQAPSAFLPEEAAADREPAASGVPLSTWLGRLLREARGIEGSAVPGTDSADPIATPLRRVPLAQLAPGRFQTRLAFDQDAISSLAQSIRARGVLQPLLVRGRPAGLGYEIISGERRWRAAREVGLVDVPVIVLEVVDREAMEIALVDNLQRQDLTPLEEAEGYRRLIEELGETQGRLAEVVGKSRSHVANMLRLLRLPEPIKALLADGKLSAGHGRALLSAANPEALARRAVEAGLSVRETEHLAQKPLLEPAATPIAHQSDVGEIEAELSRLLGVLVKIAVRRVSGFEAVTIRFIGLSKLRELAERLRQSEPPNSAH